MRMAKLSRLAGGRAPKGRRGSHAHGNNTGRIHGQYERVGKRGEVTLVHGKPLRPCGPPPLQGGGVLPPDGQTLCLIDFKSVAAYQRGSMKPFFPLIFYCPNKTAIMAAARETKGALRPRKANRGGYAPVGVSPLRPFGAEKDFRHGQNPIFDFGKRIRKRAEQVRAKRPEQIPYAGHWQFGRTFQKRNQKHLLVKQA